MIFQRIIELYPWPKLHVSSCPWHKFAVVYERTHFFNIFKFLKSRNLKRASFSPLGNLITRLHLNFLPKLRKNYKNFAFQGRPAANCTLMADSIRVAQSNNICRHSNSCYCFGIVSDVRFFALSKGCKPFRRNLSRAATWPCSKAGWH